MGLFEMLRIDEELSRAISIGESESNLLRLAREKGGKRLVDDALHKVLQGETTAREALSSVTAW